MRCCFRFFLLLFFFCAAYLCTVLFFSRLYYKDVSLLQKLTNCYLSPGRWGQTLRRFREIETVSNVELLFVGSSHAYRGFDPRIFASCGYASFNMGSTSQTPLNSYYLLRKYFNQLHPKLVILEIYPLLLSKDGLESYYDLVINLPITLEILEMGLSLRTPHAMHVLSKCLLDRVTTPLAEAKQEPIGDEKYITGGYCETMLLSNTAKTLTEKFKVIPNETQIEYLVKIIRYVRERGSNIVLTTQPLPAEYLSTMTNYTAVSERIENVAREAGVVYLDYNRFVIFNTVHDFYDSDHLTASGVHRFNTLLYRDLARLHLLP